MPNRSLVLDKLQYELLEFAGSDQMSSDGMSGEIRHRDEPEFSKVGKTLCRGSILPVVRTIHYCHIRPSMRPLIMGEDVQFVGRNLQRSQSAGGYFRDIFAQFGNRAQS